tara:strand:- start:619 stop:1695 length:1077 start_codon:yes stop_codon:yes gene_type:complete
MNHKTEVSNAPYQEQPQNWNQSHIDGIVDFMVNDMYYNGHVGYKCQGFNSSIPNHVFQAIQLYPNAGGDLSPFLLSNGAIHPLVKNQIQSTIKNLCESGSVPDTYEALACTSCPVETIIEGVDSKGRDIMVQGCEYFNNTNRVSRVKENNTWYNIGIPSVYHNMPMYPGGCSSYQPSSSGGVSSGSVSSGTTRPKKAKSPKKAKNNKMRDNRKKDIEKACKKCDSLRLKYGMKKQEPIRKLSASGCGCGSSFSGDKKPCNCGRNPGGSCQCNNAGGIREGQEVLFPNNSSAKKYDMVKFSNFMSNVVNKPKKNLNYVDPTKYNAQEDELFAYNPSTLQNFGKNTRNFYDKGDLENYSF